MNKKCTCCSCKYYLGRKEFCMAKQERTTCFDNCCSEYEQK